MKKKICLFIGSFQAGGAENYVLQLVKSLDRDKFDVYVCTHKVSGTLKNEYLNEDVQINEFSKKNVFDYFISFLKFTIFLKKNKMDVIHIHLVGCFLFAILGGKIARIKKNIIHWHGVYNSNIKFSKRFAIRFASNKADKVIAISEKVKELNCIVYKIPIYKVEVIYNFIDTEKFKVLKKNKIGAMKTIGTVGSLRTDKGIDTLIKAFGLVNKQFPNYSLEIIGDGYEKENLIILAKSLNLESKILFRGAIPNNEVSGVIEKWELFVLCSRREGFGIVLLEAMALEKAIVATNVEAIPPTAKII